MTSKTLGILFVWLSVISIVLSACTPQHYNHQLDNAAEVNTAGLRSGDLIFREGPSLNSKLVKSASNSRFSHVGIVYRSRQGKWMVVHAVPNESESHAPDWVKCEPIEEFLARDKTIAAKFMRVDCTDKQAQGAACYAIAKARSKTLFDNDYDLTDTTRLYCTELVWQAYKRQGINLVPTLRRILLLGKAKVVIFPVDFLDSQLNAKAWTACLGRAGL